MMQKSIPGDNATQHRLKRTGGAYRLLLQRLPDGKADTLARIRRNTVHEKRARIHEAIFIGCPYSLFDL
jgi:hypothetical protein